MIKLYWNKFEATQKKEFEVILVVCVTSSDQFHLIKVLQLHLPKMLMGSDLNFHNLVSVYLLVLCRYCLCVFGQNMLDGVTK